MKTTIFLIITLFSMNFISAQINEAIKFKITGPNGGTDETIIRLSNEASSQFDPFWDAWKGFTYNDNIPSLFSETSNNEALAINAVNPMQKDTVIHLKMRTRIVGGVFTMETIQQGTFPPDIKIAIKDVASGNIYELNQNQTFTFNVTPDSNNDYVRFEVFYSAKAEVSIFENDLTLVNLGSHDWMYSIYDNNQNLAYSGNSLLDSIQVNDLAIGGYQVIVEDMYNLIDTLNFIVEYEDSIIVDTDTTSTVDDNTSSIIEINSFNEKLIKTNTGFILDLSETNTAVNLNVSVYSIDGKLILETNSSSSENVIIELPKNGIYLIVLSTNTKQKVHKVPFF